MKIDARQWAMAAVCAAVVACCLVIAVGLAGEMCAAF